MATPRYVIVGGVAAGTSAAAKARRCDETAEILLFEKGPHISYAGCGLPYYLGRVIPEREKLLVISPAAFRERNRVDLFVNHEATALHPSEKTLIVRDRENGQALGSPGLDEGPGKRREHLAHVTDHAVVSETEDGCLRVSVDCDHRP